MPHDAFWLPASEHCSLYVHQWLPAKPVKAVVLLAHGMAEHAGRYQRLGQALRAAGFAGQRQQAGVRVQQVGPVKLVKRRKQLAQCQVAEGAKQGKGARFDTDRSHDVGSFLKLV